MTESIADPDIVEAFLDAIEQKHEAEEFERLMLAQEEPRVNVRELTDILLTGCLQGWVGEPPSALNVLKGNPALERLKLAYPDLWEAVTLDA